MVSRGVSIIVASVMLLFIAIISAAALYAVFTNPLVPDSNTDSIIENVKIVKADVNNVTGDVTLFVLNKGGVSSSVEIVYVENIYENMLAFNNTFVTDKARNMLPGQSAFINFSINSSSIDTNQPLNFKIATKRGGYSSIQFMIPTSSYIENQSGSGNSSIYKFYISGYVFRDVGADGTFNGTDTMLPNYPVGLYDEFMNPLFFGAYPRTDINGYFMFTNLDTGKYYVIAPTLQNTTGSWEPTTPTDVMVEINVYDISNVPFGKIFVLPPPKYDIVGFKYNDTNLNDILDSGDNSLSSWIITLRKESGGPLYATTTSSNGQYLFENYFEGRYVVEEAMTPGWTYRYPYRYNVTLIGGSYSVPDFLNRYVGFSSYTGGITGFVFNDVDADGVRDAGETGLPDWVITYRSSAGYLVAVKTNASGYYTINNIAPGSYNLEEAMRSGWYNSSPRTWNNIVVADLVVGYYNFSNYYNSTIEGPYRIGGVLYYDVDQLDGDYYHNGTDVPLPGWKVSLQTPSSDPIEALTDANGTYVFYSLNAGTYTITEYMFDSGWAPFSKYQVQVDLVYESNMTVDFGNYPIGPVATYAISGYKFNDSNTNGIVDPGENGMAGWLILLRNSVDSVINSSLTNGTGYYSFTGLPTGVYTVQEVTQSNWDNSSVTSQRITLLNRDATFNFTNFRVAGTIFNIGGQKFNDTNQNGSWDAGENVIANWPVYLMQSGQVIATTQTNATGWYVFYSRNNNTLYTVGEAFPPGWASRMPTSVNVVLDNRNNYSINFGNYWVGFGSPQLNYSIYGYKFNDTYVRNNIWDTGENRMAGWVIILRNGSGTILNITTTATSPLGYYSFSGLPAGSYSVAEMIMLSRWYASDRTLYNITIVNSDYQQDFANYYVPSGSTFSIGGMKYNDVNRNGIRDANETGISGWPVVLKTSSSFTAFGTPAWTNSTGHYVFSNLAPGTYYVEEAIPNGWNTRNSRQTTVVLGNQDNLTVDIGNYQVTPLTPYVISGYKINDTSRDGIQNNNENLLPGWIIYVRNNTNFLMNITVTNASGGYTLPNLPAGRYTVYEVRLSGNWYSTWNNYSFVVTITNKNLVVNFSNYYVPPGARYSIGGIKFNDINQNGRQDAGELPIANWIIFRKNSAGQITDYRLTNSSGGYTFPSLSPGTYYVEEALPMGWGSAMPLNRQVDLVNMDNYTVNFGNYVIQNITTTYTLSGYVFNDTNKNGIRDLPGDTGLSGWRVIVRTGSTIRYFNVTDSSGYYTISGLAAGSYTVDEVLQSNYVPTNSSSYNITISSNYSLNFANFYVPPGAKFNFGGIKFNDSVVHNGIQGPGENPIPGWTILLKDKTTGNVINTTTTNATGWYYFSLTNGTQYIIEEALPEGWVNTLPISQNVLPANWDNYTVNFANWFNASSIIYYSISGYKYNDSNNNGVYDPANGDGPIANWTISYNGTSGIKYTVITGSNGSYLISGLMRGNYTVSEIAPSSAWVAKTPPVIQVQINNTNIIGVNFLNWYNQSVTPRYNIGGYKINDTNLNGRQDSGESVIPNWGITLTGNSTYFFTETDTNGYYQFSNLAPGSYTVQEESPAGWFNTTAVATTIQIVDSSVYGVNFTNFFNSFTVSGYVYFDYDSSHNYNSAIDYEIANWVIRLNNQTGFIREAFTNASGFYSFTSLPMGNYTISSLIMPGWTNSTPASYAFNLQNNRAFDFGNNKRVFYEGLYKTFNRNEWSANTSGYLVNNFTAVYTSPNTVEFGNGNTIKFTYAYIDRLRSYLNTSQNSEVLTTDYTDPTTTPGGIFGAQVLALRLNIDYSNKPMVPFMQGYGGLTIYDYLPKFDGKTINQISDIANRVLGGDPATGYTIAELEPLLNELNNAFNDPDLTWVNAHLY